MTPPSEERVTLINAIIGAYHTTRLAGTPAADHILRKRMVQEAFARLEADTRHAATATLLEVIEGAVEHELEMTALMNLEASTEWINGFETAWKRVRAALAQHRTNGDG